MKVRTYMVALCLFLVLPELTHANPINVHKEIGLIAQFAFLPFLLFFETLVAVSFIKTL